MDGIPGADGIIGAQGEPGRPGDDSGYCQCPDRDDLSIALKSSIL
ncbi:hypothetical protein ANCDUO_22062 [Ancylostoma duodenale]|uniref:Collagen triple helix repeat protein n=1 Tax=Ancylostoma duodenale TaxID=51022 RepID=A0A0C2BVC0_9BILA|nr:hypothetical protein ANCDUO_22062 [Ancylostoma duodenale]